MINAPYEQIMICDVCGLRLNRLTGGDIPDGEAVWLHTRNWEEHDHEVVARPMTAADEDSNNICDFCGSTERLYWTYTGERLQNLTDARTISDFGEDWGACEACAPLIEAGDLDKLLERALRHSPSMVGMNKREKAFVGQNWLALWERFLPTIHRRTYTGPRREPARLNPRMMPKLQQGLLRFWRNTALKQTLSSHPRPYHTTIPGIHAGNEDAFWHRYPPNEPVPVEVLDNHFQHLRAGIMAADMYWISSDFTRLAIMAGKDFDKIVISREELPSTFGFMIFEEPIGDLTRPAGQAELRALTWTLVPGGIWINLYFQGEDSDPNIDIEQMRADYGYLVCPNAGVGIAFDTEVPIPASSTKDLAFIRTIMATWFLMTQPGVTQASTAPSDKKTERAYRREHNRPLPAVKLVDLRRRPTRATSDTDRERRQLTVRVYRSGHWKRQAYGPARSLRKTIYVSPYIAGPEGAPLAEHRPVVKVVR